MTFEIDSDNADMDVGWKGLQHDIKLPHYPFTFETTDWSDSAPACGQAQINGFSTGNHCDAKRCSNNTFIKCNQDSDCFKQCVGGGNEGTACKADSDCTGGGECEGPGTCSRYLFAPFGISGGGQISCVTTQILSDLTGTINITTGEAEPRTTIRPRIYTGDRVDRPCPICSGDTTPRDGVRDGTCTYGPRQGLSCDACTDYHPWPGFKYTTPDCPPLSGAKIADFQFDLALSTGTVSKSLTSESPQCRAFAFKTLKCMCDTCSEPNMTPCFAASTTYSDPSNDCPLCDATNAQCCGDILCGAKRCLGGADQGKNCTANSDCTSGICGQAGQDTQPNDCSGGATDCATYSSDTDSCDEGHCMSGPVDRYCTIESFRQCTFDSDCPVSGDTCGFKVRECFTTDGTTTGDSTMKRCGNPSIPVNGVATPTFAAISCLPHTSASAINTAAGLPGPMALTLPGTLTVVYP